MSSRAQNTQSVHLQGFSPEQLQEVVRGARFEHYILSRAKCDARLIRWSHGDFCVDTGHYSFPVRIVGAFPRKRLCVGYMRRLTAPTWVNGFVADETTLEFYPEGTELNYRAASDGAWVAIEFDENSLQAAARERLGHEIELPWKHVISFRVPQADHIALERMVSRLWTHPISGVLMIAPILGVIAEMLHAQQRRSLDATIGKSRHHQAILKRSDDFLRGQLASSFQLESLATATGTTARTLQRTFRDAYGVSPHEWARCLALHRVRDRLMRTDASRFCIEGIAREHGFRHMGRFSAYYEELFGELPSVTLGGVRAGTAHRS